MLPLDFEERAGVSMVMKCFRGRAHAQQAIRQRCTPTDGLEYRALLWLPRVANGCEGCEEAQLNAVNQGNELSAGVRDAIVGSESIMFFV